MKFTENTLNVLTTKTYKGVGKAWIVKHLKGRESTARLVTLLNQHGKKGQTTSSPEFEERKQRIRDQFVRLSGVVDGVVAIGDANFPSHRGVVKNSEMPIALFYRGDLSLLQEQNKNVTVIGLLDPDEDTVKDEKRVVSNLVSHGVTIVSGLALGCDTVAHEEALLDGKTVAILPSPINDILPKRNEALAEKIIQKNGLLISEYHEKAKSRAELGGRYQERDRLQALFSDCVILAASYAKNSLGNDSGARHAMNYALNYSIARAIMYDSKLNANNPKYDLNRQLIEDDKNVIIIKGDNVQEVLKKIRSERGENWVQKDLFR